jgi:hypothetical protein
MCWDEEVADSLDYAHSDQLKEGRIRRTSFYLFIG